MTTTHPPTPIDDPGIDGLLHFLRQYVARARAHEAKALKREDAYAIVDAEHASKEATLAEGWIAQLEAAVARRSPEGAEPTLRPGGPLDEVLGLLDSVVAFAYEHGYHEHGVPLVGEVREHLARLQAAALSSPTREPGNAD